MHFRLLNPIEPEENLTESLRLVSGNINLITWDNTEYAYNYWRIQS